jgi:hypothetical protein
MSDSYYFSKYYLKLIGFKSFKEFYEKFEYAVIENLAISSINIWSERTLENDTACYGCYNLKELDTIYDSYANIINHLEKNKYKIKIERKIEIFEFWFYMLSISHYRAYTMLNFNVTKKEKYNVYSFENLFEKANSILYELPSLNVCFNYKAVFEDLKDSNSIDEIEEDLIRQPDILTRTICSKSAINLNLLFENGYKLDTSLIYNHNYLKSPLHWAFFSNNVYMFNYLISNGFQIEENDIFYDSTFKKNFKFCLYLHFLRNKAKYNGEFVYKQLEFNVSQAMGYFNIYEKYSLEQIIEIFESMFTIGFDFMLTENFFKLNSFHYKYTQFASCIAQKHVNSYILGYLINKYTKIYGYAKAQQELAESLRHCLMFHQFSRQLNSK